MDKKLVRGEEEIKKSMTLPNENDVRARGRRLCRIRGKMKRRKWVRENDVVLVSPWEFKSEERGDIFFRYTKNQVRWMGEKGILTIY